MGLAKELMLIATNTEYGDLRDDMAEETIMKRVYGDGISGNGDARAVLLAATLHLVLCGVQALTDEIAGMPPAPE